METLDIHSGSYFAKLNHFEPFAKERLSESCVTHPMSPQLAATTPSLMSSSEAMCSMN